ncbi:hypothetical protein OIDMADRAFT_183875 [Oidiodendron maius Zn]|uniref:Mitochondrial division protein 1 n=1 Tax=Oidiodendron maius (strain Zn) TaxID=913774 RepID=A0A0C3GYF2_OIDMZ|nr:hypothetical protein OIDMADRAFT_183875 [Oidiodendron maius Zn]
MHLLEYNNDSEFSLTKDFHDHIPRYAILSHTWGADTEEVSLRDLIDGTGKSKDGYRKIQFCGEQANRDGLRYFWVDTCCIDKSNAVELQEAINSMFRWYQNAVKCYVYLSDVSTAKRKRSTSPSKFNWEWPFRESRWFTRGWTLQELLAPSLVEFFSQEGKWLGNKKTLEQQIHEITGIPFKVLQGSPLSDSSVPERLAWIEKRKTGRKEDKAYSLLGIFDIQMPLIYGEGEKNAFRRLREEISKASKSEILPIPVADNATFDSRAEEHNAQCHPDTRVDLLHQIETWAGDPHGKCIFWLSGLAGTGKSTISRTVALRFKEQGLLGATFFFKRGERDRGRAALFFTTLAVQLVSKERQMLPFVREALDSDPAITKKSLKEQFEKLILQPLGQVHRDSQNPHTITMVIDALDECDHDDDIKLIIYLFSRVRGLNTIRLRVLITSRPELPIRLGFADIRGVYQDMALHQIPELVIERDISIYLRYELTRIRDSYNNQAFSDQQLPPDWPGEHIQKLARMAIPLFIFAATICRFIADETWLDPEGQLAKVLNYQPGGDTELDKLDSTYVPVLDRLVIGKTGETRRRLVSDFRGIVGPIILLAEPLSALSLSQLLGIPIAPITRTLKHLHVVLDIPSRADSFIRPFHLSFRDFLVDPAKSNANEFWIDEINTHQQLARLCIQRLQSHLKRDICNLKMPGKSRTDVRAEDLAIYLPAYIQYACRYWVSHLEQSKEQIKDGDEIHLFLKYHFLHWLEALSLIGKVEESITLVNTLQTLIRPENTEVSSFLYDANRFILGYISAINIAPLQIYSLAVVFTPENSIIRRTNEIPTWIKAKPSMEQDWSSCRQTLEGHKSEVHSVDFSPDGRYLVSGSYDETIKLWDIATGRHRQTYEGHISSVNSVAFSLNGRYIASGSKDGTAKLWDVTTGQCLQTHNCGHLGSYSSVKSVAFSPDGKYVVLSSNNSTIIVWDTATGQYRLLETHHGWATSVAFSPDGRYVIGSHDHTIRLWDVATWQCRQTFDHKSYINSVTFSRNGKYIASSSMDKTINLWDVATGQRCQTFGGHRGEVNTVAFSPDSRYLTSGSRDGTIKVWDIATGQCYQTIETYNCVLSVSFSPDSRYIASGSAGDETIRLWDVAKRQGHQTFGNDSGSINSITVSPDGKYVASGTYDNVIKLWDIISGKCCQTLIGHSRSVGPVAFSSDSRYVISGSDDGTVKLWDMVTGQCLHTFESDDSDSDYVCSISFSFDDKYVVSSYGSKKNSTIKLWDMATGKCCRIFQGHNNSVKSAALSLDGRYIASSSLDDTIKLWEVVTGWCCRTFEAGWANAVTLSTNGKYIASSLKNGGVNIWDTETGQCCQRINVCKGFRSISFDRTGSCLHTDIGTIILRPSLSLLSAAPSSLRPYQSPQEPSFRGYSISLDGAWIMWNSEKLLWLPPEYRPIKSAIAGSAVVLASLSKRILIFRFSMDSSAPL